MKAQDHTRSMLRWWQDAGVDRADLAVRRSDGTMLWHHDRPLHELPLAWARAENAGRADVYVRPARGRAWAMVFLDDVRREVALRVAGKYAALLVETSPAGGCHVWLACGRRLQEAERKCAQGFLARRVGADPGSVSGEHLGRLAGFRNWKRGGGWVNVAATGKSIPWEPDPMMGASDEITRPTRPTGRRVDDSASAQEWGWVCGLLEARLDPETVCRRLIQRARPRRAEDVERYARRTVANALEHLAARLARTS